MSVDFFTVPTSTFQILYVFVVLRHDRREVVHSNVTQSPTAQWTAQQVVEAFPFDPPPRYLLRDRDAIYGERFRRRVESFGIEEIITAPRSPWQNPYVKRLIGSIRRECLNHVIVLNERHLRRQLQSYFTCYHEARTHLSLGKQCPARLEHLAYWTGLIEEYEEATGYYPFHKEIANDKSVAQVRIATAAQSKYFTPGSSKYVKALDNNHNSRFQEFSIGAFIEELERGLGRPVIEKYDIQYVPTGSPVWYYYFVTDTGYVFWVTCISCGVTTISTLLFDGYTPTVNIVSSGMKGAVTKALTRDEMLSHPTFRQWQSGAYNKENFVRAREAAHQNDSKENPR